MATKLANENLVRNLRLRWTQELSCYLDGELIRMYDDFAISEDYGNNDEKFLEFIKDWPF